MCQIVFQSTAKSIFRKLTEGQRIIQEVKPDGIIIRYTTDRSVQIRMNPDGTTRLDLSGQGDRERETIHFS